jgi:putative PIN family toxin of toxin-antitoxin system
MTRRVVFDTSSLVSASLRPSSIPDRAITLALTKFQLCSSIGALDELQDVLTRRRFDSYVGLDSRIAFSETIRSHAQIFTPAKSVLDEVKGCCRDDSDDFVLAVAFSAQADTIVSCDQDLLVLNPWRGVAILTPAQFLAKSGV